MEIPGTYKGREQALIKHTLLRTYLEKLILIVGMGAGRRGAVEICYVDAFAGPWLDESEDLSGTSIAISLQTLDKCRQVLGRAGVRVKIRTLYVEKDSHAHERLNAYLDQETPSGIFASSLHGDFVTHRNAILEWCGPKAFVFFFIDPKGWKEVGIETLRPLLKRQHSEFLINFQYDFVNRTASMTAWQEDMAILLGEHINLEALSPLEREQRLVNTYREGLRFSVPHDSRFPARAGYVRVLDPVKERPKYHLVYLTTHPRGIIEFMKASEALDLVQRRVRAAAKDRARESKSGTKDMFGPESYVDDNSAVGSLEVDQFWLGYLERAGGERRVGDADFAKILEDTDWFPGDLQTSLSRLIDARRVVNLDAPRKRPKNPLHWEENERLALVTG